MNITSKVKADVQNISGELIVSGVRTIMDVTAYSKTCIEWTLAFIKKCVWSQEYYSIEQNFFNMKIEIEFKS
jgi:hypothetical protein